MTEASPTPERCAAAVLARLEHDAARHETRHHQVSVVWRRFGDGPNLVLLHGGHGDWRHWVRNIDALSRRCTLWLPDMPGYGDSDDLEGDRRAPDALARLVDAMAGSMTALPGLDMPVDVAAFSFGALVAARIAQRGLVRRLALLGPVGHQARRRQTTELVDWKSRKGAQRSSALRGNLSALMLHDPVQVDDLALMVYEKQVQGTRFNTKEISRGGGLQTALAAFEGPVLLVWGEHDITAVPRELAPQMSALRQGIECRIIEGAGHWVQYERADAVSALLTDWFSCR